MSSNPPKILLAIDFETTGLSSEPRKREDGYYDKPAQGITLGAAVIDANTYELLDAQEFRCKYDAKNFDWSPYAQRVHGLMPDDLGDKSMKEAAIEFIEWLSRHYNREDGPLVCVGHNVQFDLGFLRQWLSTVNPKESISKPRISHRTIDTMTLGAVLLNSWKSDELFPKMGVVRDDNKHNALQDAMACVTTLQYVKSHLPNLGENNEPEQDN